MTNKEWETVRSGSLLWDGEGYFVVETVETPKPFRTILTVRKIKDWWTPDNQFVNRRMNQTRAERIA